MKKLITILLILSLLLPAAALAAEPDPIVGCWYLYIDVEKYPEMRATFGENDIIADMYFFNSDGTISLLEAAIAGGKCTPTYAACGKWSAGSSGYNVSIMGIGETTMTVSGDDAFIKVANATSYLNMKFRRLVIFNFYTDYSL